MLKLIKRLADRPAWHNLRNIEPISRLFAFDRGMPIDRIYINDFLEKNRNCIKGVLCEIADNSYSKQYGYDVKSYEILHYTNDNHKATIVGDLTSTNSLPKDIIDCFILTQTLNFIYDFKRAIQGVRYMLKKNGVALATVAGISQISRYDMDRWGDFWRFTDLSMRKAFEEIFGVGNVEIITYGNVLASTAFLQGIAAEELTQDELFYKDEDYQMTIAIKAIKR